MPDRQQRRFMAPGLEQLPLAVCVPVEAVPRVRAEPGERRHVVGAHRDVDGVELHELDPVEKPVEVAAVHASGGGPVGEPLRRQRDAAGFPVGQLGFHGDVPPRKPDGFWPACNRIWMEMTFSKPVSTTVTVFE